MRKLGRCGLNMAQIMALEDTYFPAYLWHDIAERVTSEWVNVSERYLFIRLGFFFSLFSIARAVSLSGACLPLHYVARCAIVSVL
jgi:hypothetical protein